MEDPEIKQLLVEIRDAQRELLAEYRRVANEAVDIQRKSFERQSQAIDQQAVAVREQFKQGRIYRGVLVACALVLIVLFYWIYQRS